LEKQSIRKVDENSIEDWPATDIEKCAFASDLAAIIIGKNHMHTVLNFMKEFPIEKTNDNLLDHKLEKRSRNSLKHTIL